MSTYTHGPWIADEVGDSGGDNPIGVYEVTTADGHRRVCEHLYEADARLVAAAPELLEVALELVRQFGRVSPVGTGGLYQLVQNTNAAIAKATGK